MTAAETVPLKRVATLNDDKLAETTHPERLMRYVDIGAVGRGALVESPEEMVFAESPSRARRLVTVGDTVVSTVRTYLRAVWPVHDDCAGALVVSTGFSVVRPRTVDPGFLSWVLQSDSFIEEVVARSVGVSYPAINPEDLASIPVPVPSMTQQQRISAFLDAETERIDQLIATKTSMVDLLAERLQSVIDCAFGCMSVVRRWDGVPVSPRGASATARLGALATINGGVTVDASRIADDPVEIAYLRVANVQDGDLDLSEVKTITLERQAAARYLLQPGDVLMTEGGDPDKLGRGAVWRGEIDPCITQNHVFFVRPDADVLRPDYLSLLSQTSYARAYFETTASKTTGIASTSSSKIAAFKVPVLPIASQEQIVAAVRRKVSTIDQATRTIRTQIERLRERRCALITHAVTGEMEVP